VSIADVEFEISSDDVGEVLEFGYGVDCQLDDRCFAKGSASGGSSIEGLHSWSCSLCTKS
jgi:hypothetical protein